MPSRLALTLVLLSLGFALSPAGVTAQSRSSLLSRLADLNPSEEVRAIDKATQLSPEQERSLEEIFSKAKSEARATQAGDRSSRRNRSGLDLLMEVDDEVHAILDCEQREAYRKYRRDKRWKHLEHKRSLGEPAPRARWSPSDAKKRVEGMTSKIQLTDAQKSQINAVYVHAETKWQSVQALENDAQRRERAKALHFETQDQVYAVLNCSQREDLRKQKQKQTRERRQGREKRDKKD